MPRSKVSRGFTTISKCTSERLKGPKSNQPREEVAARASASTSSSKPSRAAIGKLSLTPVVARGCRLSDLLLLGITLVTFRPRPFTTPNQMAKSLSSILMDKCRCRACASKNNSSQKCPKDSHKQEARATKGLDLCRFLQSTLTMLSRIILIP